MSSLGAPRNKANIAAISTLLNKAQLLSCLITLCLLTSLAFPLIVPPAVQQAQAADTTGWFVHLVDDEGGGIYGSSLAFDPSGNPAISYSNDTSRALKLARWTGSSWDIQTVDVGAGGSLAFDMSGNPAIAYRSYLADVLKYARWNGLSWDIQTVDIGGVQDISLAFDHSGNPGVSYNDNWADNLRYAHWNGSSWNVRIVSPSHYQGWGTDLAFDPNGNPAIALAGSIVFDPSGHPAIAFNRASSTMYAQWNGSQWDIQTVPPNAYYTGIHNLVYAHWNGSQWDIQTIDFLGGNYSSAFNASGNPEIAYSGVGGLVKYAIWDESAWQTQIVDSDPGYYVSLGFDSLGNPAISYVVKGDLRFASPLSMGAPNQPGNLSPADKATYGGLSPTLMSSPFSDISPGDTHVASQWQITYVPGDYSSPVFDSGRDTSHLTSIAIPPGFLTYAITYYWHVRYQDNHGNWSSYSPGTRFTTANYVPPDASFSATPTVLNAGETVIFTDLSTGYIISWRWDLGDGTIVEWTPDTRPQDGKLPYVYAAQSRYTVTLTVSTLGGGDVETRKDYILVATVLVQKDISPAGDRIETEDKRITIDFPENAVSGTATAIITKELQIPASRGGFRAGDTCFTIHVLDPDGTLISTLAKEVTITIEYSEKDVAAAGGNPQQLILSRYDEESGEWIALPTTVDTTAKTLSATTSKFSRWIVMAEETHFSLPWWIWLVIGIGIAIIAGIIIGSRLTRRSAS